MENLTLAISINHNWLNASNGQEVWQFLRREWQAVKAKLERDSFDTERGVKRSPWLFSKVLHAISRVFSMVFCVFFSFNDARWFSMPFHGFPMLLGFAFFR